MDLLRAEIKCSCGACIDDLATGTAQQVTFPIDMRGERTKHEAGTCRPPRGGEEYVRRKMSREMLDYIQHMGMQG